MDDSEFSKLISKSNAKKTIVGSSVLAFGVFIIWMIMSGADSTPDDIGGGGQIIIWAVVIICLGVGGIIGGQAVRSTYQIRSGKHPLLQSIISGDTAHLVWIYENVNSIKGGGSNHYIYAYNSDNKLYTVSLKKKYIAEAMQYLQGKFPDAVFGYSNEIVEQMKSIIGKKIK